MLAEAMPMGRTNLIWIATAFTVSLGGCGMFDTGQEKAKVLNLPTDKPAVVSYTGTVRGAYISPANGNSTKIRYCAEPPPDVAVDALRELGAKLSGTIAEKGEASAELRSKIENKITELSGRSEVILLTRELLYRQCELFANGALSEAQIQQSFPDIVKAVVALAQAEKEKASAQLIESSETAIKQELADSALVRTIVDCVSKGDGTIDQVVLDNLLKDAPAAAGFATPMKSKMSRANLSGYLDKFVSDSAKVDLAKATQAVQCVGQN